MRNLQFFPAKNFIDVTWNFDNPSGEAKRFKVTYKKHGTNTEKICFTTKPSTVDSDCNEIDVPLQSCTGYDITVQPTDHTGRYIGVAATALNYTLPGKMKSKLKINWNFSNIRESQLIKISRNFDIVHTSLKLSQIGPHVLSFKEPSSGV